MGRESHSCPREKFYNYPNRNIQAIKSKATWGVFLVNKDVKYQIFQIPCKSKLFFGLLFFFYMQRGQYHNNPSGKKYLKNCS